MTKRKRNTKKTPSILSKENRKSVGKSFFGALLSTGVGGFNAIGNSIASISVGSQMMDDSQIAHEDCELPAPEFPE